MTKQYLIPLMLLLAVPSLAAEGTLSKNPDRWNTLDFTQGGLSSFHGDLITYGKNSNVEETLTTQNINTDIGAINPLSEAWTLQTDLGLVWSEQDVKTGSASGSDLTDRNVANGTLSLRRYFEGRGRALSRARKNPDRWTSVALNVGGGDTIHYSAGNATGSVNKEAASNDVTLSIDTRLPLSDAWTVTGEGGDERDYSRTDPRPAANGVKALSDVVFVNAGFRRFLVGKNLIEHDSGKNPDRWAMIFMIVGARKDVSGKDTITSPKGDESPRDTFTRGCSVTLGTRLPITNHMSLRFEAVGANSRDSTPYIPTPAQAGSLSRLSTFSFTAGLRYFLF